MCEMCLIVFLFALARNFIKTQTMKITILMCHIRTGTYSACRRVLASFNQEALQAGAVKGLKYVSACSVADLSSSN